MCSVAMCCSCVAHVLLGALARQSQRHAGDLEQETHAGSCVRRLLRVSGADGYVCQAPGYLSILCSLQNTFYREHMMCAKLQEISLSCSQMFIEF